MLAVVSVPLLAIISGAPLLPVVVGECKETAQPVTTPGQVARGGKVDPRVLGGALRQQAALLLDLTSDRLMTLARELTAKKIDQETYNREAKSALEQALTSETFRQSAASKSMRAQMPRATAEVKPVCVVGLELYGVVQGKPVVLTLTAGEGQLAGTALRLNGNEHPFNNPKGPQQIGTGDLSGSVLHVLTTVLDVNPSTNRTAVTDTLRGGTEDRDFPYTADVLGDGGAAYYLVSFFFK